MSNVYASRPISSFVRGSETDLHRRTFGAPFEPKAGRTGSPKPLLTVYEHHSLLRILEIETANPLHWFVPTKGNSSTTVALHRRGFLTKAWCVRPPGFAVNHDEQDPDRTKLPKRLGYRVSPAGQQALDAYDGPKHFNQGEAWIERQ